MTDVTFADALKAFRRGCHQNPEHWRAVALCDTMVKLNVAWDEARYILEAGSIPIQSCELNKRTITMKGGATIRFLVVDTGVHTMERMAGQQWCQIIWLFEPDAKKFAFAEAMKRSVEVKTGLRTDMASL